ncbi:MAG: sensor histidine kinase [Patescibacteria group bacterium]
MATHTHGSLRTRLAIAYAALGLVPLVLMGLLALRVITITYRQDVATMETQLLRQKAGEIKSFIDNAIGLFEIRLGYEYASIPAEKELNLLLTGLLEENEFIEEAAFLGASSGEEVARISRTQKISRIQPQNLRELPEFKIAMTGEKYFGPVNYSLDGPLITLAAPVKNSVGQVIMVLTGKINLTSLRNVMASARLGENGYVYLVDKVGTIIASADPDYIYRSVGGSPWIQGLLNGQEHKGLSADDERVGLLGVNSLTAGLNLENLGWGLVAEWPKADAFAVVATIQREVLIFSFVVLIAVILLGWLAGRQILRPLAMLSAGAAKIGSGQFDYKIDITTRDELEALGEVMNRMGEDLKRLEELKAVEIRAEALAESLRKERELSKIKDEFITNTSHQLRTPLTIMNWNLEVLSGEIKDPEHKKLVDDFGTGLSQINAIVHDLLTVSEYGPGFKNKIVEKVDWGEILGKVVSTRDKAIKDKGAIYEQSVAPNLPEIKGNPIAMQTVLENLLDNAITYTSQGGKINVKIEPEAAGIKVSFSDSGIGIPEADKQSIFMQFFRAKNAINMKNVGTGLGLYICKNIVEGHGGKIGFESTEGKGTTVFITVPINNAEPAKT